MKCRGISLVEMAVACAITGILVVVGHGLVGEGLRATHRLELADASDLAPFTELRLRTDVAAASRVENAAESWTGAPLVLRGADGSAVTWEVARGVLTRNAGGSPRPAARGVASWRWRSRGARLVVVELRYRARPDPFREGKRRRAPEPVAYWCGLRVPEVAP